MLTPKELPIFNKLIQFFYGTRGIRDTHVRIRPKPRRPVFSIESGAKTTLPPTNLLCKYGTVRADEKIVTPKNQTHYLKIVNT